MDEQQLFLCTEYIYTYLYILTYGNDKYTYNWNERSVLSFNNFAAYLDSRYKLVTIGKKFLTNYFLFQYSRIVSQELKRWSSKDKSGNIVKNGRFQIYDFISESAFEKWINRDKKFDFCLLTNYKFESYAVNVTFVLDVLGQVIDKQTEDYDLYEETIKKGFYNTSQRLFNCINNTTMYSNNSILCKQCSLKKDCLLIQEKNYPIIFKNRTYERTINV